MGPLSPQQAWREMNCTRLAAQILKLKERGYTITTEMIHNGSVSYATYRLH